MTSNNNFDKNKSIKMNEIEDDEGTSSSGSVGGKVHYRFRDAASLPPRDDALPPNEKKRLLTQHADLHKDRVDKQKQSLKDRAALKEGKKHLTSQYQQGYGASSSSSAFQKHMLADTAQFSGIDKQVIGLPSEFDAETNLERKEKLENRFQHRHVPKFHPKPRPAGG